MLLNLDRALAAMEERGLDAIVATRPENVYYLSDYGSYRSFTFEFQGVSAAILPRDPAIPATLLCFEFDMPYVGAAPSWMPELRVVSGGGRYGAVGDASRLTEGERRIKELYAMAGAGRHTSRTPLLLETLRGYALDTKRIGVDDENTRRMLVDNGFDGALVGDGLELLRDVRLVKTPDELTLIRQAVRINETALRSVGNMVVEGISAGELVRHYKVSMAGQDGYGSHITGGGDGHPWPGHPDLSYRLKEGDIVHLDAAGWFRHYWADIGRTGFVGTPTALFEERYAALQETHRVVDPLLVPGSTSRELLAAAREALPPALPVDGLLPIVHSIGVEQWERVDDDFTLEAGMVIAFETVYFELGWGVLQLEDMFLVGDGPPERLVSLPQEPFTKRPAVPQAAGY